MNRDHYDWNAQELSSLESLPDPLFQSLTHPQRQSVLRYLQVAESAPLDRLAEVVTGLSTDGDRHQLATPEAYRRTRLLLHHVHLPRLDHDGLIKYDPMTHRASVRPLPEVVFTLLDVLKPATPPPRDRSEPVPKLSVPRSVPTVTRPLSSLGELLDEVERTQLTLRVFAPDPPESVLSQFVNRNVTVESRSLPPSLAPGFAVVLSDDRIVGFCHLDVLTSLDDLARPPPWGRSPDKTAYTRFLDLFRDSLFATTERTQLLSTSREIEDRAWRGDRGHLYAGFQSLSTLRSQLPVYRELGGRSGLSIHVYGRPDWFPPMIEGVTIHPIASDEIGRFWFVVYRDPDGENSCALVAEERTPDEYYGFWTYEESFVDEIVRYLDATHVSG